MSSSPPEPSASHRRQQRQQQDDSLRVAPYLTHVVAHHGQLTLIPPQNAGRIRKPAKKKKQSSARERLDDEEPRFTTAVPPSSSRKLHPAPAHVRTRKHAISSPTAPSPSTSRRYDPIIDGACLVSFHALGAPRRPASGSQKILPLLVTCRPHMPCSFTRLVPESRPFGRCTELSAEIVRSHICTQTSRSQTTHRPHSRMRSPRPMSLRISRQTRRILPHRSPMTPYSPLRRPSSL